jgi:hypothetical protein
MVKEYNIDKQTVKIEANHSRIAAVSDPVQLSKIFFPQKGAYQERAAFLAIMYEIRNSRLQKAWPEKINRIPKKWGIDRRSFDKCRAKLNKIGLISKSSGYWRFSDRFKKSMDALIMHVESLRYPSTDNIENGNELIFIESAKGEPIYRQIRKRNKYAKDEDD